MFKSISLTLWMLCIGCTLNIERTTIDGENNKYEDKQDTDIKADVKANAKVPLVGV